MDKEKIKELIDIAIEREEESYEFYSNVATVLENPSLKQLFTELANEEIGHKNFLLNILEKPDAHVVINAPKIDYKLAEQVELPKLSMSMKPAEAIALAMKKELQAAEFYQELAANMSDENLKASAISLANMELAHKTKLEKAYVDIAYIEAF
ncbi:MAG: ferritin family protein [Candidatus Cloacimonas sp.]|nr:ferritin family protein [Candidatus Cloacimonadota bacterium]